MYFRTDDPVGDFNRYDRDRTRWLQRLPTCERCGDAIQQERAVCINGFWFYDECLEHYRREVNVE